MAETITEFQYLRAKETIRLYEKRQKEIEEKLKTGDINLLDVLSARPKNAIISYNQNSWVEEEERIIFASDLVRLIHKEGSPSLCILKFKNIGMVSYIEIIKYINPYLPKELKDERY